MSEELVEAEPCSNCGMPEETCDCCECDECDSTVSPRNYCNDCDRCKNCCECSFCDHCGDNSGDSHCSECDCCEGCCDCTSKEHPVTIRSRSIVFHLSDGTREPGRVAKNYLDIRPPKGTGRNPSRRFISCELEILNTESSWASRVEDVCRKRSHSVVEDGSISDESGFEINTSPAQGDVFITHIEELCDALDHHGATVDISCGYHVHVDARDFGYWDIRRLCKLYAKIEDGLFQCVSRSRRTSDYCQSCGERYLEMTRGRNAKEMFAKTVYSADAKCLRSRKGHKHDSARYAALNLHSWLYRGTIECRMHQGTTNAKKVWLWGTLWAGILDYVSSHSEVEVDRLEGPSFDILLRIAPTDEVRRHLQERRLTFIVVKEESE